MDTQWKPLGLPALIFGYISVSTLTILPAWSVQEGFIVHYHLFLDGEKIKSYEYEITRKAGVWLGLLPFIWANLFTYSEADAFKATAFQFFEDAEPLLSELGNAVKLN